MHYIYIIPLYDMCAASNALGDIVYDVNCELHVSGDRALKGPKAKKPQLWPFIANEGGRSRSNVCSHSEPQESQLSESVPLACSIQIFQKIQGKLHLIKIYHTGGAGGGP